MDVMDFTKMRKRTKGKRLLYGGMMNIKASNDFKDSKVIFSVTVNVELIDKNDPDKNKKYKYKTLWEKIKDSGKQLTTSIVNKWNNIVVKDKYSTFIKEHPKYRDFAIGNVDFKSGNSGAYYADTKNWTNDKVERQDPNGNVLRNSDGEKEYELRNIPLIESSVTLTIRNTDPIIVYDFCQELCKYFKQESVIMIYNGHTYFVEKKRGDGSDDEIPDFENAKPNYFGGRFTIGFEVVEGNAGSWWIKGKNSIKKLGKVSEMSRLMQNVMNTIGLKSGWTIYPVELQTWDDQIVNFNKTNWEGVNNKIDDTLGFDIEIEDIDNKYEKNKGKNILTMEMDVFTADNRILKEIEHAIKGTLRPHTLMLDNYTSKKRIMLAKRKMIARRLISIAKQLEACEY